MWKARESNFVLEILENLDYRASRDSRLGGRFGFFFFLLGEGEFEEPGGGGIGFLLKMPGGGGGVLQEGEGPRGREGVCGELGNYGTGGGAKYFFFGAEMSTK